MSILLCLLPLALCAPSNPYAYGLRRGYAAVARPVAYAAPAVKAPACRTEYETVITKQVIKSIIVLIKVEFTVWNIWS